MRPRARHLTCLLIQLLHLAAALAAATSQSAPVWVSGDEQREPPAAAAAAAADSGQLQASSSSHEPSIVSLDVGGTGAQLGERRSDQAESPAPSDQPDPSGAANANQTNAQVQFDPDEPPAGRPSRQQPLRNNRRADRRQDLNETRGEHPSLAEEPPGEELNNSSQPQQHETFDTQLLNHFIRHQLLPNSSFVGNQNNSSPNEEFAQEEQTAKVDSLRASEPTVELEPSPILIPMTSAQTAFGGSDRRRKLHTAGTQYDFRDTFPSLSQTPGPRFNESPAYHEDADIAVAFAGAPTSQPQAPRRPPHHHTDLGGRLPEFYNNFSGGGNNKFGFPRGQDEDSSQHGRPRRTSAADPQTRPRHHFGLANDRLAPLGASNNHNRHFWTGSSLLSPAQGTRRENPAPWLPPARPTIRRPPSFNYNPQGFSHFAVGGGEPFASADWPFGAINHQAQGGPKSSAFVRGYAGPMVFGGPKYKPPPAGGKPKRSLLSSLGSRINSWVSEPLSNGKPAANFEENFWARQPQRLRLRPPAPPPSPWQKAANFYLVDQLMGAGSNQIRFPGTGDTYHHSPFTFYPPQFGFNGASHVRQPTVAPAPSSLDKFFGQAGYGPTRLQPAHSRVRFPSDTHLAHQSSHHLSRYAPAKTLADSMGASSAVSHHQQPASFVPVVAVSVTKTSPAPRQAPTSSNLLGADEQQSAELSADLVADYLDMKTGRMNRNNRQQLNKPQEDYGNMASGSVSSDPATGSPQAAEQTTTVKSAIFGYLPQDAQRPLMQAISTMLPLATSSSSSNNNNNNNNNKLQQHLTSASDAYVNQVDQVDSSAASGAMLPASDQMLDEPPSLLLQLQANHFAQNDIAHPFGRQHQRPKPSNYDGLYSTPGAFQLVQADSQAAQALMNPLLGSGAHSLLASASELNPLLPAAALHRAQHRPRPSGGDDEPGGSNANGQSPGDEEMGESGMSKRGKKRSGEFFASAGQLLLSALPLLLAPTLGLMFAAGPTLPVARYQAPGGAGAGFTTGSGSLHSSIPGNFISGQVSQAVPAHVFTPNPPSVYNATTSTTTSRPAASVKPVGQRAQVQSPAAPASSMAGRSRPPPSPPPTSQPHHLTMTLTTLGPPVFTETSPGAGLELTEPTSNEQQPSELINYSPMSNSSAHEAHHLHHHHHHVGNTILLLANNLQAAENSSRIPANESSSNRVKYDLSGYEGADFDAQFANLNQRLATSNSSSNNGNNQTFADDAMLELATSAGDPGPRRKQPQPQANSSSGDNSNNRLFPVSTWPPMRRRTVSVVTLNGNKTFSDASDRYQAGSSPVVLDYYNNKRSGANVTRVLVAPGKQLGAEQAENSPHEQQLLVVASQPGSERHQADEFERQMRSTNRSKRSTETTRTTNTDVQRQLQGARRVVRVVRRRPKEVGPTAASTISQHSLTTGAKNQSGDPLRVEASKSKPAHIITAVLAQVEPPPADEASPELADNRQQSLDANEDYNGLGDELGDARLRELVLRRKILLDRLASKSLDGGDEANFGALGRGRFPQPPPPPPQSPSLRLAASARRRREQRLRKGLVLTEDTKRALMDFGSLLIKDTLEVEPSPGSGREPQVEPLERPPTRVRRKHWEDVAALPRPRRKDAGGRRAASNQYNDNEALLGQATERSTYVYSPDAPDEAAWHPSPPPRGFDELLTYNQQRQSGANNGNGNGNGIGHIDNNDSNNRFVPDRASLIDNDAGAYVGDDKASPASANQEQVGLLLAGDYNGHAGYVTSPSNRPNIGPSSRHGWPRQRQQQSSDRQQGYGRRSTDNNNNNNNIDNDDFNNHFNHSDRRALPASGPLGHPGAGNNNDLPHPLDHYANGAANGAFAESGGGRRNDAAAAGGFYDLMMRNYPSSSSTAAASSRPFNNGGGFSPGGDPTSASGSFNATTYAPNIYVPNHLKHNPRQHHSNGNHPRHPTGDYPAPPTRSPAYYDAAHHQHYLAPGSGGQAASPTSQHHQRPLQPMAAAAQHQQQQQPQDRSSVNDYLKRVQFSDTDRDKLMASYLTCDGLLNDNDHCLERLSCEFSDPQNIERANKLDRAVSSILLGHILINNYIEHRFKLRLKSASLFGYTHSGQCSKFICNKLSRPSNVDNGSGSSGDNNNNNNNIRARA